jgi:protein-S-isoprenylcysteine O-methyltransferase Ste14
VVDKVKRNAAAYFAIQGVAVLAWWISLYLWPEVRVYFQLERNSQDSLMAFWLVDIAFWGVGSLVSSWLIYREDRLREAAAWFVTGCVSYASVYCLAFAWMTDHGWLGVTLMFPAMIWSGVFAVGMTFETAMFRPAAKSGANWILLKTFTQIFIVWGIILVVIPILITYVEDKLGIPRLLFTGQWPVAGALFVTISSLGVYAAYVMSRIGKGTPLPLDHARELVIKGPYAYVRNPMAVSGVGQGLAVALFLGSPLVAAYALMGSLIWQLVFRPLEEAELLNRFGAQYQKYADQVKCWVPRRR